MKVFAVNKCEYTKNPGSTPLLTGLIVSLVGVAGGHGLPLDSSDRYYICFVYP
jgi:hypothetical protein